VYVKDIAQSVKFMTDGIDDRFGHIIRINFFFILTAVSKFGDMDKIGRKRRLRRKSSKHEHLPFFGDGNQLLL